MGSLPLEVARAHVAKSGSQADKVGSAPSIAMEVEAGESAG